LRVDPAAVHQVLVIWAGMSGLSDLTAGVLARGRVDGELFLVLNGLITAFLGLLLVLLPGSALTAATPLIGVYACLAGIVLLLLGVRLAALPAEVAVRPTSVGSL
jgi:hypothetical protein